MRSIRKPSNNQEVIPEASPKWSGITKLVVAISLSIIGIGLVSSFQNLISPLLISFILAYLLYPVAGWMSTRLRIAWRLAVWIIFLVLLFTLLGLLIWGGLTLAQQIQSLVNVLDKAVKDLPRILTELNASPISIGPFQLDLRQLDLSVIGTQLLGAVQPLLGQIGGLVGTFATSAVIFIGWAVFILWIVFFILHETGGIPGQFFTLQIPGYQEDVQRILHVLNGIWNTFLRRQFLIIILYIINYTIILGILQVHFFFGLALLAGLARFIPYIGATLAWGSFALVSFLQGDPAFGLSTYSYVLLVAGVTIGIDQFMDNLIVPKLMANALRVHPAVVMIVALIAFNWIGVIGLVLAAPAFATLKLLMGYVIRKMLDQDPWKGIVLEQSLPGTHPVLARIQAIFMIFWAWLRKQLHPNERSK